MSAIPHESEAAALQVEPWHPWFAWHPVRLYMTGQFAWLRQVYRRHVVKPVGTMCEYTDDPGEFPDLTDVPAKPPVNPRPVNPNHPARTL